MTYLKEVFKKDKKLGFILGCFLAITLVLNFLSREVTPFYVFAMFAGKTEPYQMRNIAVYAIKQNANILKMNTLNNISDMKFTYTIPHYDFLNKNLEKEHSELNKKAKMMRLYPLPPNSYNNSKGIANYPQWITNAFGLKKDSIQVIKYRINFSKVTPQLIDSTILINGITDEL